MIAIPAAGNGQRFKDAGYDEPKHMIPLAGSPMIVCVIENVMGQAPGPVRMLTQAEVGQTRGTAETIAKGVREDCGELLIANCDQLLKFPKDWKQGDGVVFTFPSASPAHSYVETDASGLITGIVEKQVVGNQAVSGVYWFKDGAPLVQACKRVLDGGGELYLSLALELLIADGWELFAVSAPTAILGTPEDYQRFEVAVELAGELCF